MSNETESENGPTDNAELYRNSSMANRPMVNHKYMQFISVYNDNRILIGASNLSGRFWNSSLWLYNDCSTFDKHKAVITTNTESCICDGAFVDSDTFVVVEDSGVLQILNVSEDPINSAKRLNILGYTCQHDDSIFSVSVFENKSQLVTGGADRCLKVWNINDLIADYSYNGAHKNIITCVDVRPKSNSIFASASLDCEAVVWDIRRQPLAEVMYSKDGCALEAVAWHPGDDNVLAVGDIDGCVTLLDIRKPRGIMQHSKLFNRAIRRLVFDPKRGHLLAACCDNNELKVLDTSKELSTVYEDKRHTDFVRGLAWYNEDLLSCSWDNTILIHPITAAVPLAMK